MANTGQFNLSCSGELCVELHRPGILGMFRHSIRADCLQFSTHGIQVETQASLRVGDQLVLDLKVNDMRVEELPAIVRSASAADNKHYYNIDFQVEQGRKKNRKNTQHCLRHLEQHVRASQLTG